MIGKVIHMDEYVERLKDKIESILLEDFELAETAMKALSEYDNSPGTIKWITERYDEGIEELISLGEFEEAGETAKRLLLYDTSRETRKWLSEKMKEIALLLIEEEDFETSKEFMEYFRKILEDPGHNNTQIYK
jgi:Arc/MetJ-type ribon-helix-helix transcriptional regulator